MAQIVVHVNDRPYAMQCKDGEEQRLVQLAELIDREVREMKRSVGQVGDSRLLLMAGLVIADRLDDALGRIEILNDRFSDQGQPVQSAASQEAAMKDRVAKRLTEAAIRLETLSRDFGEPDKGIV
ncbi:MAG: cell division protein ZapA [Hyphomicrobiales bacterium]